MIKYLVQDIETIPETELQGDWAKEEEFLKSQGKPHNFPPIVFHKVACIGMLALDEELKPVKGGCAAGGLVQGKSEKEMIERWSSAASGELFKAPGPLCMVDWHGRGFDVPVLQTRAFRYGIRLPWYFGRMPDNRGEISSFSKEYRDRYSGMHLDLAELWTNHGAQPRPHMAALAKLMGLPGKLGIDGSKVYDAFKEQRFLEIDTYCMQDVYETAFIFQRFYYMAGKLSLDAYRLAVTALVHFIGTQPDQAALVAGLDLPTLLLET